MNTFRNTSKTPAPRPSVSQRRPLATPLAGSDGTGATNPETLVSRRRFLYGAIGAGAVAAIGIGAAAYTSATNAGNDEIDYLNVPEGSLTTLNDFEALESAEGLVQKVGEYDLPYGTLVWASDDEVAACLLPTETGSPLTQIGLLYLESGNTATVLQKAQGASDGFEVYDVRANGNGVVWTEANILQEEWRIYAAPLSSNGSTLGTPHLLEEGGNPYETPTLAVAGSQAFWQVNPKATEDNPPTARLMSATFGKDDASVVLESSRRMSSPPYVYEDTVTIAPRIDSASAYYQLTNIDAKTGDVLETLTLPHAIKPIESGYGKTGFMFSFPDIYDYKGAIANLGTYLPRSTPSGGDYNGASWFSFTRTPTAPPAWCDDLLIVKSTYSVCGVNLQEGAYFALDVDDGADTYGEYLASTGSNKTFVTYTNIDHTPVGAARIYTCRVKVYQPLTPSERRAAAQEAQGEDAVPA